MSITDANSTVEFTLLLLLSLRLGVHVVRSFSFHDRHLGKKAKQISERAIFNGSQRKYSSSSLDHSLLDSFSYSPYVYIFRSVNSS